MKRFYKHATPAQVEGGWQVMLDTRGVKTQGGRAQCVPTAALAEALTAEWQAQGDEIDPGAFVLRDMADYAIDVIAPDRAAAIAALLPYGETDTLCYRAEPGEALYRRQQEHWEPLLAEAERRWGVAFERVSGIIHRSQPQATLARLQAVLEAQDDFTLAALRSLSGLAASLVIALAAIEPDADAEALWNVASLEEDFQAELWGKDAEAEARRARRLRDFTGGALFTRLVSSN